MWEFSHIFLFLDMDKLLQVFHKQQKRFFASNMEEVSAYIDMSVVPAHIGSKCVDGRYLPDQAPGMVARPGADCGYVMVLEAVNRKRKLGLTPEQCFNAVYKAVTELNGKFYLHTDYNCDPDKHTHKGLIGCGHVASAARRVYSWEYDVRSKDIKEMVNYVRNLCEISQDVEMVNLAGQHKEKGVFVVDSDTYTVLADNPKLKQMYFVYDRKRDLKFMKKLVEKMALPGVLFADMAEESNLQLDATLQNLAVGLPVYSVTFGKRKPRVAYLQHVVQKPLRERIHLPLQVQLFSPKAAERI